MIVGTGKLIEWFSINNKPFWIIRRSEKSDIITRSPEDDSTLDIVKSKEILQQALSLLSPEIYYIQTWGGNEAKFTTAAKTCVHFRLLDPDSRNGNQQSVISGIDPGTFDSKVEAEVSKRMGAYEEKQALLNRIGKLEEQVKDGSGGDFWDKGDRVLGRIEKWIPNFIPGFKISNDIGNIKQVNKEDIKEMKEENVARIENTLAVFQADLGEEKTVELMEKLGSICQNDNDTFKFLIKKLE
jgi:hypothetical protein